MARCREHDILADLVTPLPLLIANNSFRNLESMQDKELEVFLRYLLKFTSRKEEWSPDIKPVWWGDELEFPKRFGSGNQEIPFTKNKPAKLRSVIQNCYRYYDLTELLVLSEKLARKGPHEFFQNRNGTVSVFGFKLTQRGDRKKLPVAVVPVSNLFYEAPVTYGALMNTGVKQRLRCAPVKRTLLNTAGMMDLSDAEDDDEFIDAASSQFSDEEEVASSRVESASPLCQDDVEIESISSEGNDDAVSKEPCRPEKTEAIVDLTNDEDDDFAAQILFMKSLGLGQVNGESPQPDLEPLYINRKAKYTLKKINAVEVPFMVRMGILPKACLASYGSIERSFEFIAAHTKDSAIVSA